MRIILALTIILFSLQSWTRANDIRDFQIEEMSVGDSLLDYMTISEIKNNKIDYGGERQFFATSYNKSLSTYDRVEIWLKSDDDSYKIYAINSGMYYENNLDECLKQKKKIINNLEEAFENFKFSSGKKKHDVYKDSMQYTSHVYLGNSNDNIRVECISFGKKTKKKNRFKDYLSVLSQSGQMLKWIRDGYK
jgi:hypothetical protein